MYNIKRISWRNFKANVSIHPELEKLLPQQTPEEIQALDDSLKADGLRDNITVCKINNVDYVLDGHTRYRRLTELELFDEERIIRLNDMGKMTLSEAIAWMYLQQLGRRNLTDKDKLHIIGKLYNSVKEPKGGDKKSDEYQSGPAHLGLVESEEDKKQNSSTAERLAEQYSTDTQTITKNQVKEAAMKATLIEKVFLDASIEDEKKLVNSKVSLKDLRKVNTAVTNDPDLAKELTEELKSASTAEEVKEVEKKVKQIAKTGSATTKKEVDSVQKIGSQPEVLTSAPTIHKTTEEYKNFDISTLSQESKELWDYFIENGCCVANITNKEFFEFCKIVGVALYVGRTISVGNKLKPEEWGKAWASPFEVGEEGKFVTASAFNTGFDVIKEGTDLQVLDKFRTYFSVATGHHQHLNKLMGKVLFCHGANSLGTNGKVTQANLLEQYATGVLDPTDLSVATEDLPFLNTFNI